MRPLCVITGCLTIQGISLISSLALSHRSCSLKIMWEQLLCAECCFMDACRFWIRHVKRSLLVWKRTFSTHVCDSLALFNVKRKGWKTRLRILQQCACDEGFLQPAASSSFMHIHQCMFIVIINRRQRLVVKGQLENKVKWKENDMQKFILHINVLDFSLKHFSKRVSKKTVCEEFMLLVQQCPNPDLEGWCPAHFGSFPSLAHC